MACLVTAEFVCKKGMGKQMLEDLREVMPGTRKAKGLIDVVVHIDQDNPDRIFLVEHWDDRAAHEAYVAWRAETGDLDNMGEGLAEPPKISYFDPTDA